MDPLILGVRERNEYCEKCKYEIIIKEKSNESENSVKNDNLCELKIKSDLWLQDTSNFILKET